MGPVHPPGSRHSRSLPAAAHRARKPAARPAEHPALRKDADTLANVSNIGFAVGGAALVAGVVVFLTAPSEAPAKGGKSARPSNFAVRVSPTFGAANGLVISGSY